MKIEKLNALTDTEIKALDETLDGYQEYFKGEISRNVCELWKIDNGESYAITRLEHDEFKKRNILVVCCYKGKNLESFVDYITDIADKNNWLIRFHTFRPALARWMNRKFNFNKHEYISIREPNHG